MSFTYDFDTNPRVAYIRLLVSDTTNSPTPAIFTDEEINAFYAINGNVWQSAQFYSGNGGLQNLPTTCVSYYRVAALALDSLASNRARLAAAIESLDVKVDIGPAAKALKDQAQAYRDLEDNSGSFAIAETVGTVFAFHQRFWAQVMRQSGG